MRLPACKSSSACVKRTVLRLDECAMIIQHTFDFNKVCRVALYRQMAHATIHNYIIMVVYLELIFCFNTHTHTNHERLIPDLFWPVYRVGYWGRCALVAALSCGATQAIDRCMGVVFHNCKQASSLGCCITLVDTLTFLPFSSKVVVCGHCLVTLPLTINETLKWLSLLPILMQESSGGDSVAIGMYNSPPPPP